MTTTRVRGAFAGRGAASAPAVGALAAGLIAAGLAVAAAITTALTVPTAGGDYQVHAAPGGDNAAPALAALVHGQLGRAVRLQPMMGLGSLLLRAPAAAVATAAGAGQTAVYRAGVLACLIAALILVAPLVASRSLALGPRARIGAAAVAVLVVVAGPATRDAVILGHPEEILAGALAVAAVVVAQSGRPAAAGLLAGAAVGTKQWAVLAVLPVLVALPSGRRRALAAAAGAAVLLSLPALADPGAFLRSGHAVGSTHLANRLSAWWPLGTPLAHAAGADAALATPATTARLLPLGLDRSLSSIVLLVPVALAVTAWWRSGARRGRARDALALLALLELGRCLADPAPLHYYLAPLLISVAVLEARRGRPPLIALATAIGAAAAFSPAAGRLPPALLDAVVVSAQALLAVTLVQVASDPCRSQTAWPSRTPPLASAPSTVSPAAVPR